MSAKYKLHLLLTVLILGGMALFYQIYDPWRSAGPELIQDGGFESAEAESVWSGWGELTRRTEDGGFQGSAGVVLNTTSNRHGTLRFTINDLTGVHFFRASLAAAAANVRRGTRGYHIPRAVFFYQDKNKKSLWRLPHGVMNLPENSPWKYYSEVFPVPAEADTARFHIQNYGSAGELRVDDISIQPVVPRGSEPWWNIFFGTLWLGTFGRWLFILRPWKRRYGALVTLTSLIILSGVVMPGPVLDGGIRLAQKRFSEVRQSAIDSVMKKGTETETPATVSAPDGTSQEPKKPVSVRPAQEPHKAVQQAHISGHLLLFCLLAFLALLCWSGLPIRLSRATAVFGGLVVFAVSSEILQMITPDRKAGWEDLLVDLAGITGAVLIASLIREVETVFKRRTR